MSLHIHVPVPHDPNDPPFDPNRPNAPPGPSAPKKKSFWYIEEGTESEIQTWLNAVDYRAGHRFDGGSVSPAITDLAQAKKQLLRKDLGYRFRVAEIVKTQKHKRPTFEANVRRGKRWRGWGQGPWYVYLGTYAHTPTDAEHQAYIARRPSNAVGPSSAAVRSSAGAGPSSSAANRVVIDLSGDDSQPAAAAAASSSVAVGAAVQTGVVIPPKPILPPYPCMSMSKPKGPLYPTKHPYTEEQIKAYNDKHPGTGIRLILKKLYEPVGSPHNALWMYKAIGIVCREIDPATACLMMEEWLKRVLASLQWEGFCEDFELRFGNEDDAVELLATAYTNKVMVFTPLDDGKVPTVYVDPEEAKKYTAIKTKFDADMEVYEAEYKKLEHWQDTYGALADTIIPPALDPNDEDVEMTTVNFLGSGKTLVEERKRKAIADTVCIDCDDPKCGCVDRAKEPPKVVKKEPAEAASSSTATA